MTMQKLVYLALFLFLGFVACSKKSSTSTTDSSTASVSATVKIDMSQTSGAFRDVLGINKAPRGADSQAFGSNTYNLANLYSAFGVSTVRALDSNFDVCNIFSDKTLTNVDTSATVTSCTNSTGTHVSWAANNSGSNINNSSSYSFTTVDTNLDAIYNSGASLYLRLGENNNGPSDTTDSTNYATAAKNLYKHISGQGGGFGGTPSHTMSPAYIEVWNEPDGSFWMGTKANFFTLYNAIWDAVDSVAPSTVKIGGPAWTTTFQTHVGMTSNPASTFVSSVTTARLDFMSGHVYGSCDSATLAEMQSQLAYYRSFMDSNGLSAKPLVISEWNIGLNCSTESSFQSQRAQSFNSAIMSIMQDSSLNIEKGIMYNGFGMMSFFTLDTANVGVVTVHPGAWALKAHSNLKNGTLVGVQVCDSSSVCQSGASTYSSPLQATAVNDAGVLKFVLANDSTSNTSAAVQVSNWSGSASPTVTLNTYPTTALTVSAASVVGVYTVSSTNAASLISSNTTSSTGSATVSGTTLNSTITVPARTIVYVSIQ